MSFFIVFAPGGCLERVARSGSCRESVRGVVGTMNAVRSRPDWLATVQCGCTQAQRRVCTPGLNFRSCIISFPANKVLFCAKLFNRSVHK